MKYFRFAPFVLAYGISHYGLIYGEESQLARYYLAFLLNIIAGVALCALYDLSHD